MDIFSFLDKDSVILNLKSKTKKVIISTMLDFLIQRGKISEDQKKYIMKTILRREEMGSTAIGNNIALPHARIDSVKDVIICLGLSQEGLNFDSLDQEPVNVVALLLSNSQEAGLHLKVLARLARMLRDKYLIQRLKNAKTEEEIIELLSKQQQAVS